MVKELSIEIPADLIHDDAHIRQRVESVLGQGEDIRHVVIVKRSIDARKRNIKYNLRLAVYIDEDFKEAEIDFMEQSVNNCPEVHIIGSGPAGLFAALQAIELGLKPILFERGKNVRDRRRDLAKINKEHLVDPDSNYCFGEGGAGTYSDGKLYTRSKKRGDVKRVLELLVYFGADRDILVDAHPHIGTNKLPKLIENIRECILRNGGEIHFESRLTDLRLEEKRVEAIQLNGQQWLNVDHLVLATGHSARDIFYLLHERGIKIEAKPFALGVRVEHAQSYIDQMQYHGRLNDDCLPPAAYSLVAQIEDTGVYSFCMCPGGIIAPCATDTDEVVTNGWSPSKRNNPYANSGIVVQVQPEEVGDGQDPFSCLNFQTMVEHDCWEAAGKTQAVPAQRLPDFMNGRLSHDLPKTSYQPGIVSVDLSKVLPDFIVQKLHGAFVNFDRKMKGFVQAEAVIHAPESRTSSPVKIPRKRDTFEHQEVQGLYPVGEGAGYAGGIVSAAVDGMNCLRSIKELLNPEIMK